jgi:DNA-binding HxlR family transcriptional regulator
MIEIHIGSTEELIIRYLQRYYPVTFAQLHKTLHLSPTSLKRTLLKLQHAGIVHVDPLPGRTYVRLLRTDISFIGPRAHHKPTTKRPTSRPPTDYDGIMYS